MVALMTRLEKVATAGVFAYATVLAWREIRRNWCKVAEAWEALSPVAARVYVERIPR